jgi:hypothetical protein
MRLKLDLEELTNDFFAETRLFGIVAPVKDYQFCWQLNNFLRFDFRINNEIEIQLRKRERKYFFGVYEYLEPNSSLVHYLYNNQFDGEYLLPEFRHLDFLWLLKGDAVENTMLHDLMYSVKNINAVQLVTELTHEKIKNKGHLIF